MFFLSLEWSWLQLKSSNESPRPKSTKDRLMLGAAAGGFVLPEFCSQLSDFVESHWTTLCQPLVIFVVAVELRTRMPGVWCCLINKLVTCFEIHWSDLSACVLEALVPLFIYVQTDKSCLLLLSPNRIISGLCAVLLLTFLFVHLFCPLCSSAAFAFPAALSTDIFIVTWITIERHWYLDLLLYGEINPSSLFWECTALSIFLLTIYFFSHATPSYLGRIFPCTAQLIPALHPFHLLLELFCHQL